MQRLKIVGHRHAQKVHRPKFQNFFEMFTIFHDFAMNIIGIKTKNVQTISEKSIYGTYTAHHELKDTLRIH